MTSHETDCTIQFWTEFIEQTEKGDNFAFLCGSTSPAQWCVLSCVKQLASLSSSIIIRFWWWNKLSIQQGTTPQLDAVLFFSLFPTPYDYTVQAKCDGPLEFNLGRKTDDR